MIFRLSQTLNGKINAGPLSAMPLNENPSVDWSAHSFVAGRKQFILLSNTTSLYSTVIPGTGSTNASQFVELAFRCIRERLEEDGFDAIIRQFVPPASESVQFAKTLNRSVTGSMNELIQAATSLLVEDFRTPHDASNDLLLSILARSSSEKYGKPRAAFNELVSKIKA